jgi:protease IV
MNLLTKLHTRTLSLLSLILALFLISLLANFTYGLITSSNQEEYAGFDNCNVAPIQIRGELFTYIPTDAEGQILEGYEDTTASADVTYLVEEAEYTDEIKGILIEVDSFGGSPAAAEEVANALKASQKPVAAFIRGSGLSAAYFAITPADKIFALKSSDVGSIGVTQSYVDNVSKNQSEGYSFVQLSVGKFKDAGSPDKPLTQEEKNVFMRDLHILQENFIQTVSENRNIAIEKVRAIADGSSVLGVQAKELGLIDEIGDYTNALMYLEDEMEEEVRVCW